MRKTPLTYTMIRTTMTIAITFPLLVWSNYFTNASSPLCDSVCACRNFEEEGVFNADCSRVDLSIVPPMDDWPSNVTQMDLSANKISTLDTELAHSTLQVLDLSYNRITHVVQNAFGGLNKLNHLNLANNIIRSFDDNGFYGLDHLKSLNLSSNGLETLPDKIFYNFIGLEELSLADNPLGHLDPVHLNRMVALKRLDLSNTNLYALAPNMFHTTGQLEILDLSANQFYEVPTDALRSAKKLYHLILNENKFEVLDKKSFIQLNTLEILELNNLAHLVSVTEKTFSDLTDLRVLEMNYNHQLRNIDVRAFYGLFNASKPTLKEIDLEGNQLQYMDRDTVACARIKKFNVQKNPWVCDCNMRWIKKCEIQRIYSADLKCFYPEKLENAMIYSLTEEDFVCDYQKNQAELFDLHHTKVVKSISVAIGVGLLAALALAMAIVFKWQKIKSWYKYKTRGPGAVYYVRARSNPVPATNDT